MALPAPDIRNFSRSTVAMAAAETRSPSSSPAALRSAPLSPVPAPCRCQCAPIVLPRLAPPPVQRLTDRLGDLVAPLVAAGIGSCYCAWKGGAHSSLQSPEQRFRNPGSPGTPSDSPGTQQLGSTSSPKGIHNLSLTEFLSKWSSCYSKLIVKGNL